MKEAHPFVFNQDLFGIKYMVNKGGVSTYKNMKF